MSGWRVIEEPPVDFFDVVYGKEETEDQITESEGSDVEEDESHVSEPTTSIEAPERSRIPVWHQPSQCWQPSSSEALPSSPLTSSVCENRDRSRSPILGVHQPTVSVPTGEVVVKIFEEDCKPLGGDEDGNLTPDAHALFEPSRMSEVSESGTIESGTSERGTSEPRGRARGAREGGRRRNVVKRKEHKWACGHPLHEKWPTDSDVPSRVMSMAQIVRDRVLRGNAIEGRDDDEFCDARDANEGFEWFPMETFKGSDERFKPEHTGPVHVVNSAYQAFRAYWDDDILGRFVTETNQYAAANIVSDSEWVPTNEHEILCLFAFWIMLGVIKMPTTTSCFSADPLLKTEVFRAMFTLKRYEEMCRVLQFIDTPDDPKRRILDRLYRLKPIISHLNSKFQSNYTLDRDICIAESLTLCKGKLGIQQSIRSQPFSIGVKTFELCESATGYIWSFLVFTSKQPTSDLEQPPGIPKRSSIVRQLIEPLLNKGYRLFTNNLNNSPRLARFLKRNGTDCVGTLSPSCSDIPFLINKAPLRKWEIIARHSGDVTVLAWQDKRRETMISTCHGSAVGLSRVPSRPLYRPVPFKPHMALDYDKFMGEVEMKDQMLEPYVEERERGARWYVKLLKHLLNVSILNSRTLLQSSTQKHHDDVAFRLQLVDSILSNHLAHCPVSRKYAADSSGSLPIPMYPATHWPNILEQTSASTEKKYSFQKRCVVCLREGRKFVKSSFGCETCRVPLCIKNCFKYYHTSPEFLTRI